MARHLKIAFAAALVLLQVGSAFASSAEMGSLKGETQPPLRWRSKVISISLSTSLLRPAPNIKGGSDVVDAVRRSLKTWEEASGVEFREVFSDRQNVSPQGQTGDGISLITVAPSAENALLFAKNAEEVAATTRVFFDGKGRISEADIVLNPYQQFSTDGTFGTFDLESALTHEIGHVLGLEHSSVRGSTMYENFGKNGFFGLQNFSHRTLSEVDKAAVRAKYGVPADETCCGSVSAKLLFPEGRAAAGLEVWLEDSVSGKVVAQSVTGPDGTAEFGGLPDGTYSAYSARKERSKRPVPMQPLGSVEVVSGTPTAFTKKLETGTDDIEVLYTGFNGQLSLTSVPVNAGRSYTIYIGGRNLKPRNVAIGFNSPFLALTPGTVAAQDYGDEVTVLSFEVRVDPNIPVGEYTILVESATGGRAAIVGALSVRSFINPFGNFIADNKLQ